MNALRENIRRALTSPCTADILGHFHAVRSGVCPSGVNRLAFGRLHNLILALRTGAEVNANKLARALRTCTKTITRDIAYLRSQGFKITYVRERWTYQLDPSLVELKGGGE